jgi:peptide/nickel transport system substrate-binding protein/oligopeptide transport system substrate-binding protein
MTYVKNENYRDADNVTVNTLNFMLTSDNSVAYSAYQTGDLDFISDIPTDELGTLIEKQDAELHTVPSLGTYYVGCNYNASFYQDLGLNEEQAKVFRHALCLLIDRQNIIDNVGKTGQKAATSFVPEGCADGNGGEFKNKDYFSVDDYDANVEEAKSLLESIGLWDGNALTQNVSFNLLTNDTEASLKLCECLQQDWGQLGMEVVVNKEESGSYFADRKAGNFDVVRANWLMDYNDPINMLEMWTSTSGNNYCGLGK